METFNSFSETLEADGKIMFLENISSQIKHLFKPPGKEDSIAKKGQKKVTVFLVDDDPLYLKALELSLTSYIDSLIIFSFRTGEACLHQMKQKPAIVILDYYLNSEISYAVFCLKKKHT